MATGLKKEEIARHNKLYKQANDLIRNDIMVDGQPLSAKPNLFARIRLRKAIGLYDEVLKMNPQNWATYFMKAKALHRLGESKLAFELMLKAHHGNPTISGFAREAGIIALQLGHFSEGVNLTEDAIKNRPEDGSLYSNLGLGQLLCGNASKAIDALYRANELEPNHPFTLRLLAVAQAIKAGKIPYPHSDKDVFKAARRIDVGGHR
jgi:Flp pilus assembly protein TadD